MEAIGGVLMSAFVIYALICGPVIWELEKELKLRREEVAWAKPLIEELGRQVDDAKAEAELARDKLEELRGIVSPGGD